MKTFNPREKVIDYVLSRHCRSGGFCFYRLDEPNGSDCYHALSILNLLDIPFRDEQTAAYLKRMQHEDGSYDSLFSAFYSIKSLLFLKEKPTRDPVPYLLKHLNHYAVDVGKLPVEILSVFKRLLYLVDLYRTLEMERDEETENNIAGFVLSFQNEDHGFGNQTSNLTETAKALVMLQMLGYPVQALETEGFIRRCETPLVGFTDIPHRTLSYLEYIHAGVEACCVISHRPRYLESCVDFILDCQNMNGGFSRAPQAGIATLENTFFAVHAGRLLSDLEKSLSKSDHLC